MSGNNFSQLFLKYLTQNEDSLGDELCEFSSISFTQEAFMEMHLCARWCDGIKTGTVPDPMPLIIERGKRTTEFVICNYNWDEGCKTKMARGLPWLFG